jgi:hypothetical protein
MASHLLPATDLASTVARLFVGRRAMRGTLVPPPPARPPWLKRHAALTVPDPLGKELHCLSGELWVTQDGDPRDVILIVGQSYLVERAARMVVSALQDAEFELLP